VWIFTVLDSKKVTTTSSCDILRRATGKYLQGGCFVIAAAESVVMKIFNELNGGNFYAVRYADNINILIGNFIGQLEVLPAALGIFRQRCDKTQLIVSPNQISRVA
jgi:hypothetical protein